LAQILSAQSSSTGANIPSTSGPSSASGAPKGSPSGATSNGSSPAGGSGTASTATNSAAQLASDQASIDSAQAALVSAQQSLNNATLTAPIGGTVASVGLSAGQSVTSGSSSATIIINDPGSYQTSSSLSPSQVGEVAVGDKVQVTVDGQRGTFSGTVTRVGPVDTSTSSYTYPLFVALAAGSFGTGTTVAGSDAHLAVETAGASHTLVVPTSAVHTTSLGASYVMVLKSGHEVRTAVKVGVVGAIDTQITSGLLAGAQVVLADPSEPVATSSNNTTSNSRRIGTTGGFPTGGLPTGAPAGLPSFGPPGG
jgi:trimeric autotransporter adhesin